MCVFALTQKKTFIYLKQSSNMHCLIVFWWLLEVLISCVTFDFKSFSVALNLNPES